MSIPTSPRRGRAVVGFVVAASLALLAACSDGDSSPPTTPFVPQKITVTSVLGSIESELLSSIYAQALERAGFRVARRNAMEEQAAFQAVADGDVQVLPTTTDVLLAYLDRTGVPPATVPVDTGPVDTGPDSTPSAPSGPVEEILLRLPANLAIGAPAPASQHPVIACSGEAVTEHRLSSYTSLALAAGDITIGAAEGFETSEPLGLATWEATYRTQFAEYVAIDPDEFDTAVKEGTVDCLAVDSLDPVITSQAMTILDDDQRLVPTEPVVPLLAAAAAGSDVLGVVDAVSGRLTTALLNQMLNQIVEVGLSPDVVAKAFLDSTSG